MTPPPAARPTTIDEYLAAVQEPARSLIAQLRALVREELPAADEAIRWGNPAFVHPGGTILLMLSVHKAHATVAFTPSTKEAFAAELEGVETGKGTIKLHYGDPVPEELLRRMIRHRLAEHEDDGVGWM